MQKMDHNSCNKISDPDEYNSSEASSAGGGLDAKPTGKSSKPAANDKMRNKRSVVKPKRERKSEDDDVTLTFPQHLMEILDNESLSEIISWLPHGKAFILVNKRKFAKEVLGQYFKRSKFSSFTRKLNRWGFQRVARGEDAGAYFHPLFQRNNLRLCLQMTSNGTKATKEYNAKCHGDLRHDEDETTAAVASVSEQGRSVSQRGYGSAAPPSPSVAARPEAAASKPQFSPGTMMRRSAERNGPGVHATTGPSLMDSMDSNSNRFSHSASVGAMLRRRPSDDLYLSQRKDLAFPGTSSLAGPIDDGQRSSDITRRGGFNMSPASIDQHEAALMHLRHLEARSRFQSQPPYLVCIGAPSMTTSAFGLVDPFGVGGLPYSSSSLGYMSQLRQMHDTRQRLPPHLHMQLAQVSLADPAPSNPFPPSLLPPLHVQAVPPPAPFPVFPDQMLGSNVTNRKASLTTLTPEHCFFPAIDSSSSLHASQEKKE